MRRSAVFCRTRPHSPMRSFFLMLLVMPLTACAQSSSENADPEASGADQDVSQVTTRTDTLRLGETPVRLVTYTAPVGSSATAPLDALVLHDDENTAVEAGLDVLEAVGGRLVELRHTGQRNVSFDLNGEVYVADPNRMFTDAGARRTLDQHSVRTTPEAVAALRAFGDAVRAHYLGGGMPRLGLVLTLHNNTPDRYSARSYVPDGVYADDAADVHLEPETDSDNFFFVTDEALHEALAARGFSTVLQDNDAAADDGSLSVWAAQAGVPYVNVEAEHGQRAEQARMIHGLLGELGPRGR